MQPREHAASQVEKRSVGEVHIASVSVEEAWTRLKRDTGSVLIDVRTIAEWAYVGLPDLSTVGKRPVLVEWQGFPDDRLNMPSSSVSPKPSPPSAPAVTANYYSFVARVNAA